MSDLTERQLACLRLIADGHRVADLVEQLHLSESAVKETLRALRHKLGATTTAHAVAVAARDGLLTTDHERDQLTLVRLAARMGYRLALIPREVTT